MRSGREKLKKALEALEEIEDCMHGDLHLPDTLEGFEDVWEHAPKNLKHSKNGRRWISRPESISIEREIASEIFRIGVENFRIFTGGPGSGKSTRLIQDFFERPGIVMAPSGVAAQRLSKELTFKIKSAKPMTIHAAMQLPVTGSPSWADSKGNAKGKKRADAYYIDEASMIDTDLFRMMLKRIKAGARVYLYGDPDQLPPVGLGCPLLSMMDFLPHTRLEGNHRTTGKLGEAIKEIREGRWPEGMEGWTEQVVKGDFGAGCRVAAMYAKAQDAQVLCPWRASAQVTGRLIASINRPKAKADFTSFIPGDKVVACHSIHAASIVNGVTYKFLGKTSGGGWRLEADGMKFSVPGSLVKKAASYSIDRVKDPSEWETSTCFLFSGALTIHKSQGSQYEKTVILIHDSDRLDFYSRELLYVAASRSRNGVHVVFCASPDRVPDLKEALLVRNHDYMSNVPAYVSELKARAYFKKLKNKA